MAKVEMTRAEVAEAIRKEPRLTADVFVRDARGDTYSDQPPCSFCAVGAVVRKTMAKSVTTRGLAEVACDVSFRGPMQGLSNAYEISAWAKDAETADVEAGRTAAIAFVMGPDFPDTITIDIGNAKPRRGMRVVS